MSAWAAIFDWDGVIVDSAIPHEESWRRLAAEEGRVLPPEHFKRGFGMKNEAIIPALLGWTHDPEEIRRLSLRKEALYRAIVTDTRLDVLPGVMPLLRALRAANVPCAVASSTPRVNITFILDRLGLTGYFRAIVAAEDVRRGKPDPEVFLFAAQQLQVPASRCVVFEDTPVGLQAAHAAGMKAVAVTTTHPMIALHVADRLVGRIDELTTDELRRWCRVEGAG